MAINLSTRERELIDVACGAYHSWAAGETSPPLARKVLSGGHNNAAVLLEGVHQRWVIRICNSGSTVHDRAREFAIHQKAAARGLAPAIAYADARLGILVMEYIAHNVSAPTARTRTLQMLAILLREIHRLPATGIALDSITVMQTLLETVPKDSALQRLVTSNAEQIEAAKQRLAANDPTPVLCHNDLLVENRLFTGDGLLAIDWEYAAAGDAFFDIAVCCSQLTPPVRQQLLACYLEREASTHEQQQLQDQGVIYAVIEASWFYQRARTSEQARRALRKLQNLTQTIHP